MSKKLPYLDKRVSTTFSLKRKIVISYEDKVSNLGLDKNHVMEELMLEWIKKLKNFKL
jgi:hypothetical protein